MNRVFVLVHLWLWLAAAALACAPPPGLAPKPPAGTPPGCHRNGKLTNQGWRSFEYDADGQLTAVSVAGAGRVEFVDDGLNRKRIERSYQWQSGAWVQTNETRFVCDRMLVIQERRRHGQRRSSGGGFHRRRPARWRRREKFTTNRRVRCHIPCMSSRILVSPRPLNPSFKRFQMIPALPRGAGGPERSGIWSAPVWEPAEAAGAFGPLGGGDCLLRPSGGLAQGRFSEVVGAG